MALPKRILVTGAAGSIGQALCRRLAASGIEMLYGLDQDEARLSQLQHRLACGSNFSPLLLPLTASIPPALLSSLRVDSIIHAAAYKQVPFLEQHFFPALINNFAVTCSLLQAAEACGVKKFLLISTDKAASPCSVLGASKRLAELYIQAAASKFSCQAGAVRLPNVIGSRGSVMTIFRRQLAARAPLTVTHPRAERYFISISSAVDSILLAEEHLRAGEIVMPALPPPTRVLVLARRCLRHTGQPETQIKIIGLRPGERLREPGLGRGERLAGRTSGGLHRIIAPHADPWESLMRRMYVLAHRGEIAGLKAALHELMHLTKASRDTPSGPLLAGVAL